MHDQTILAFIFHIHMHNDSASCNIEFGIYAQGQTITNIKKYEWTSNVQSVIHKLNSHSTWKQALMGRIKR